MGTTLEEEICTRGSGKKPHMLEWGNTGVLNLGSCQAKQTPHHIARLLGNQKWENRLILERFLEAMAHSRPGGLGWENLHSSHAGGSNNSGGLLEG